MVSGSPRDVRLRCPVYYRIDAPTIAVEVCSNCHPLWTGQQKFLDTAGRVEKFNQRAAMADKKKAEAAARKARKQADAEETAPASV